MSFNPAVWFAEGGVAMHAVTALDLCAGLVVLLAVVLAFVARFSGKMETFARVMVSFALFVAFLPTCAGFVGQWWGEREVNMAVAAASDEYKTELMELGYAAAEYPRNYGCASTLCCFFPAVLAMMVAPRKRAAWEEALDETNA